MRRGAVDVVIRLDDFARVERKSCFWVTRPEQQAEFLGALHGLGVRRAAPSLSKAQDQWVFTVFSETKS